MRRWPAEASTPAGGGGLWPRCRYRGLSTAGWSWPSTSPAGCGRPPTPRPSGSCATPTDAARISTSHPRLAVLDHLRTRARPQLMDRTAGRPSSGTLRRHRHRHRPTTARAGRSIDHGRPVAGRRPGHPRHRGRRLRRTPSGLHPARSARAGAGPDAFGPCPAQGRPAPPSGHDGTPAPARRRVRLRTARHLGRPGHRDRHRHPPLRHRPGPLLGPAASQADPPLLLGRSRWNPPHRETADRWTWLVIAARTQLRLARPLAADRRRPWEKPSTPDRLTSARVRRDFRHIRPTTACPAQAPKPSRPGPGRPPGRKAQPAQRGTKKSTAPRPRRTG